MNELIKNQLWIILFIPLSIIFAFIGLVNSNFGAQLSAYVGILFLFATLLPSNLLKIKFKYFKKYIVILARYRRDIGILTAVLFFIHTMLSIVYYEGLSFNFLFSKEILYGLIGDIILIILLVTSNRLSIKSLKRNWIYLHGLIWFLLPFSLFHTVLSHSTYQGGIGIIGVFGFMGLILFGLFDFMFMQDNINSYKHVIYIMSALIICIAIIFIGHIPNIRLVF